MRLPILGLFSEALGITWAERGKVAKSILYLVGVYLAILIAALIVIAIIAVAVGVLGGGGNAEEAGNNPLIFGLGFVLGLLVVLSALPLVAHLFNTWVRVGAVGPETFNLEFEDGGWGRAMRNAGWFLLIAVVMVGVALGVELILGILGFEVDAETEVNFSISASFENGFGTQMIGLVGQCFVYSFFSGKLTRTALGLPSGSFGNPYLVDFAVILMLLSGSVTVITYLAALTGNDILTALISTFLGLLLIMPVSLVHGLRYRFSQTAAEALPPVEAGAEEVPTDDADLP